jgi:hypothetical protein
MAQGKQEGARRGCRYARLAPSDYQAPEFHARLGYTRYGLLANCPPGETVSYFWKPLPPTWRAIYTTKPPTRTHGLAAALAPLALWERGRG